ncbi:MAG: hypothetical protein K6A77_13160 [Clostridiales bacterium]|nr:hypothetical protein [Clostridiales bacterium]
MLYDLSGQWTVTLSDGSTYQAQLPGTLDENRIGHPDATGITTRLTRVCTYEGPAIFTRIWDRAVPDGRLFLEVERSRALSLTIDGAAVAPLHPQTISTPTLFEVTGLLQEGSEISFTCDNAYPGMPHDNIVYSSAATDETQTNWNGLLGYLRLRSESDPSIEAVRVYPHIAGSTRTVDVYVDVLAAHNSKQTMTLTCPAFLETPEPTVHKLEPGRQTLVFKDLAIRADALLWDEYEGNLYTLQAALGDYSKAVDFGLRTFSWNRDGRFTLNGRVIFIRSEANCCEFPETGHAPMTVPEWLDVLKTYRSYGINCMRFHSHCPPEAAFTAADQLGMLMQPELSHWNPRNAFESPFSRDYYFAEAQEIVRTLADHPSFVMLTFGNELWAGPEGHVIMHELIHLLQEQDGTRLYANGSNVHYGRMGADPDSDFYASQKYFDMDLRGAFSEMKGFINQEYPSATHDYNDTMEELRKVYTKPVFSFEVGQFEVLPDFDELADFQGVRLPVNLEIIRDRVQERGLLPQWKSYVEATGEVSLMGYRAEIEAVLRTPGLSGISLLGLQDFTGQGTALVGMLNSHLEPKPFSFADPKRFHQFFNDVVLLALLPHYTWTVGTTADVPLELANYGKHDLSGAARYTLKKDGRIVRCGALETTFCKTGGLTPLGTLQIAVEAPGRYDLDLSFGGYTSTYPLWFYADQPVQALENVTIARTLDGALEALAGGKRVFLSPPAEKDILPHSIRGQFTTDFWSVGTFPKQEGGMSLLIDQDHPALAGFPTENHTNYQWWAMSDGLGVIVPETLKSIITLMDSYAYLRPMTCLFEAKVGSGRLMFSSMGLLERTQYPEVRALIDSLLTYISGDRFDPQQELSIEALQDFFK